MVQVVQYVDYQLSNSTSSTVRLLVTFEVISKGSDFGVIRWSPGSQSRQYRRQTRSGQTPDALEIFPLGTVEVHIFILFIARTGQPLAVSIQALYQMKTTGVTQLVITQTDMRRCAGDDQK